LSVTTLFLRLFLGRSPKARQGKALAVLAAVGSAEVAGLALLAVVVSIGIGAELAGLANRLSSW